MLLIMLMIENEAADQEQDYAQEHEFIAPPFFADHGQTRLRETAPLYIMAAFQTVALLY